MEFLVLKPEYWQKKSAEKAAKKRREMIRKKALANALSLAKELDDIKAKISIENTPEGAEFWQKGGFL